jgi:hypothetical protein
MRRKVAPAMLVTALLAAATPSVTPAAVMINIDLVPIQGPGGVDTVVPFEVWANDLDGSNERLDGFAFAVQGSGAGGGKAFGDPNGVRFVVPGPVVADGVPVNHPYVFKDIDPFPPVQSFNSTSSRLQIGASTAENEDEANIDPTHNGLLRYGVLFPANAPPGPYTLTLEVASLSGKGASIVTTVGPPVALTLVPEPTAAALLLVPPLALLRRRRGA